MSFLIASLGYFHWDPSPALLDWEIPFLGRPILWYGFLFGLGFLIGYFFFIYLLRRDPFSSDDLKTKAVTITDRFLFYIILGTLIGSRIGDVLFYQSWSSIAADPFSVVRFWEGGLASHGGSLGVMIAVALCVRRTKREFPSLSWKRSLDLAAIPTSFVAAFIRLGNFMNQEIIGKPSTVPWAIVFGHPVDGGVIEPRHPAQLYEALWYCFVGGVLFFLWKRRSFARKEGRLTGLFLFLLFTFRFFIEFLKVEQSAHLSSSSLLTMGQILSLPFMFLGVYLIGKPTFKLSHFQRVD